MSVALYTREILRLAVSIPHEGRLNDAQGTGERRSKTCGSHVICDVNLLDDGSINELGIKVHACALGQASAAILMKNAEGQKIEAIKFARNQIAAFLTGEQETPGHWDQLNLLSNARDHAGRHAAIILPYDALIAAYENAAANEAA